MSNIKYLSMRALSKRELEVVKYLMEGYSNKKIADILYISERTVKFHCTNIYKKLGISNRLSLVSKYSEAFSGQINLASSL